MALTRSVRNYWEIKWTASSMALNGINTSKVYYTVAYSFCSWGRKLSRLPFAMYSTTRVIWKERGREREREMREGERERERRKGEREIEKKKTEREMREGEKERERGGREREIEKKREWEREKERDREGERSRGRERERKRKREGVGSEEKPQHSCVWLKKIRDMTLGTKC